MESCLALKLSTYTTVLYLSRDNICVGTFEVHTVSRISLTYYELRLRLRLAYSPSSFLLHLLFTTLRRKLCSIQYTSCPPPTTSTSSTPFIHKQNHSIMATKLAPRPGSLTAKWKKIAEHEVLKRSSHSVAAIGEEKRADGHELFVFGGELVARQPKDGGVHIIPASPNEPRTLNAAPPSSSSSASTSTQIPTPRVGSTMAALQDTLYIFSGRGGPSMAALGEEGAFWTLTPSSKEPQWTFLSPKAISLHPEPRSYHSTTTDSSSQIFIQAGCAASGRLRDFWSFDITTQGWKQLSDAPGPARGGTSLCFAQGKVWRFGGFDGEKEIGGVLDWYDVGKGEWGESVRFEADGVKGPGARSVAGLVPVVVGDGKGKLYLVAVFGEADPSSLGHEGAGKMLGDVWAFDVEGRKWRKVDDSATAGSDGKPAPRGWFGAAAVGPGQLAVVGGLGEDNDRLGDAWVLEFE
jgi:hypothetical protein